ncbi:OmpA family protein, partial [Chelatococcus sp. GW1]
FAIGSAEPQPQVVRIMQRIAETLSKRPGKVVVRGHTDGRPFRSADYDNWRLSTARAHMAVYMLVRGGLSDSRVERVEGHADRLLKVPDDPNAAENRRIEILLKEESP